MDKKNLFIVNALLFSIMCSAAPVDSTVAKMVATNYYHRISSTPIQYITLAYTETSNANVDCYFVFNVNQNDGFVIVSADDAALPIIGYSTTGHFETNNQSPNFIYWMNDYKQQILGIKTNSLPPTQEIQDAWLENKNVQSKKLQAQTIQSTGPLLSTTWNQSPYYNAMCPGGSVTGCDATAMAQIMKYWNYPASGNGTTPSYTTTTNSYFIPSVNLSSVTYNWSSMPNNVTSSNSSVATLMYDCGVSVQMDYGPSSGAYVLTNDWSGNHPFSAQHAYTTYFGYDLATIQGVQQLSYSTTAAWVSLIENEIDAGRPVQYAGWETGPSNGHTWVCDGYNGSNQLHMNWGWGGNNDGYYTVGALNPSYQFNTNDEALIGIQPANSSSTELITNGDFSGLYNGWTISGNWYISNSFSCYNSATAYAYLGDASGNAVNNAFGNLSQNVTIPANATSATLSYSVSINTNETSTSTTFDYMAVYFTDQSWNPLTSTTTYSYGNLQGAAGASGCQTYITHSFSVPSNLFGQNIKLVIHGFTDGSNLTKLRVDDISLTYVCSSPGVATVNGNNSGCSGVPITFNASASNATSYNWTAPAGWSPSSGSGTSFTTMPGSSGNVTATPINNCGSGSPGSVFVTVNPVPGTASVSGNTSGCAGSPITFTASASNATSYSWSAPAGWSPTSGSGASFTSTPGNSGNVSVTPSNSCGNGAPGTVFVNINPLPGTATVSGSSSICVGTPITFNASSSNATAYNWTAPAGWAPSTGSGTTFTSTPGASGNVSATPSNSCGNGSPGSTFVTVNQLPSVTLSASNNTPCINDGIVVLNGAPANGIFTGPGVSGNSFNPSVAGIGPQTVIYTYTDPNNCSNSSSITITVNACVGISESGTENSSAFQTIAPGKFKLSSNITSGDIYAYNMLGEIVFFSNVSQLRDLTIDLSDKPNGIYFISIKTSTGALAEKVLVSH